MPTLHYYYIVFDGTIYGRQTLQATLDLIRSTILFETEIVAFSGRTFQRYRMPNEDALAIYDLPNRFSYASRDQ